jgi:hypothetical protein
VLIQGVLKESKLPQNVQSKISNNDMLNEEFPLGLTYSRDVSQHTSVASLTGGYSMPASSEDLTADADRDSALDPDLVHRDHLDQEEDNPSDLKQETEHSSSMLVASGAGGQVTSQGCSRAFIVKGNGEVKSLSMDLDCPQFAINYDAHIPPL